MTFEALNNINVEKIFLVHNHRYRMITKNCGGFG